MEHKTIRALATKILDADQGIVEHIVAVMGNRDLGGDVIHRGAFAKTLVERGHKVKVLDQHRTDSTLAAVGRPMELREVGREGLPQEVLAEYPEATGGLWAKTQFLMDTPEGRGVFARIKAGAITEWSFGYDAVIAEFEEADDGQVERHLKELKLFEISPVLWGMNPATTTLSAKAQEDLVDPDGEAKGVSGATNLPLASRERPWSAAAAIQRVRTWAEAEDEPNAKYRRAFFWFDGDDSDNFTAYKLPFADVVDGELQAVPRGLFAVAGALRGARTPLAIPHGDQAAIKGRVARYYGRMREEFDDEGIVPPWEGEAALVLDFEGKVGRVLSARNATRISAALQGLIEVLQNAGIELSGAGPEEEDKAPLRLEQKLVDLQGIVQQVIQAFYSQHPDVYPHETGQQLRHIWYVTEVWDEFVIVREELNEERHLWQIGYSIAQEGVQFAPKEQWVEGVMMFVPLAESQVELVAVRRSTAPVGAEARGAALDGQRKQEAGPPQTEAPTSVELEEWMTEAMKEIVAIELMEVEEQ